MLGYARVKREKAKVKRGTNDGKVDGERGGLVLMGGATGLGLPLKPWLWTGRGRGRVDRKGSDAWR